jgi:hypothetical protein
MERTIQISTESKLARILKKMADDKRLISEHLKKGGKLKELDGKIGL